MKKILFLICLLCVAFSVHAQNNSNWTGAGNWSIGGNWSSGTSYGQLQFQGAGNAANCVNDVSGMSQWRLYFNGSVAYNLTGTGSVNLFDFGGQNSWVLSDASANQTINFPINFNDGGARTSWITARNTGSYTFNGNLGTGGNITGLRVANTNAASSVSINTLSGSKTLIIGRDNVDANQANTRVTLTGNSSGGYSGAVFVHAGTLFVNGSTAASSAVSVSAGNGATLAGSGTIGGTVSLSGDVSPGGTASTTATLTTGGFTFNGSSSYRIEMNNATGASGNANGWDRITSTGVLTCSASPITLNLVSLAVANFDPATNYTWPIASGSSVSGFNTSNFTINTASFAAFTGTFAVTLSGGNTINLVYTAPTLAPGQPSAISGATALCNGATQTYSVTNDPNATSYEWTLPGGWSGSSTTNSIDVTVANPGGTISVVARNSSGDSLPSSLVVAVGVSTSITSQPSTSAQSVCLGTAATSISVVADGASLTYQWYSNVSASNSGGTLIPGAASSSYTPTYVGGTTLYYYCVVGGLCPPTSITSNVSGAVTISGIPSDNATYGITSGGNGGQGFGPWSFLVSGGGGGTFNGGSDIGQAWGIYANSGGLTSAIRPFAGPLAMGSTISFAYDNGGIETNGNKVGVRLRNSSNNILSEFRFIGGDTQYTIADASTSNTGVNFTTTGLSNITFAYTAANTYSVSITRSGVTTELADRTFATVTGGQVPAQIEFFNSNAGGGSARDVFFNDLSIGKVLTYNNKNNTPQDAYCQNSIATALSAEAYGIDLGYQWYSNPGGVILNGQTSSTLIPPTATVGTNTYYCVVSYTGTCGTVPSSTSSGYGAITVYGTPSATISSSVTACQNAPATITFTGSGGTPPYEFSYTVYEGGIIPPRLETVTTTSGSSVTVSVPTSALGSIDYALTSCKARFGGGATCSASASGLATVTVNPSATFYADADGDTYGNLAAPVTSCDGTGLPPVGSVTDTTDCDDNDPFSHEKFSFYADADGDTFGFGALVQVCAADAFSPPTGYSLNDTDCDDTDSRKTITYPFYVDADLDTYGTGALVQACAISDVLPPTGFSLNNTDCDDTNELLFNTFSFFVDADQDTFGRTATGLACAVDALSPPAGFSLNDTDCDDSNALKTVLHLYYVDADGDTYGSTTSEMLCTVNATSPPTGFSVNDTDCDDLDALKFNLFSFYEDVDGDTYGAGTPLLVCGENSASPPTGYSLDGTDCDDENDAIYRSTPLYVDLDGDGYDNGLVPGPLCYGATLPVGTMVTTDGFDCADSDALIYRSATLFTDADSDTYTVGAGSVVCYGADLPAGSSLTQSQTEDCDDLSGAVYRSDVLFTDFDLDSYTVGAGTLVCWGGSLPFGTSLTSSQTEDCDDADFLVYRTQRAYNDADSDGYTVGTGSIVCYGANLPAGTSLTASSTEDCDDADPAIFRVADLFTDLDGDGHDDGAVIGICIGANIPLGTSLTTLGSDCDDTNALIYRSATLYTDVDNDIYTVGAGSVVCYGLNLPAGTRLTASTTEDCDDTNAAIFRSATLYDDVDGDGFDDGAAVVCYGASIPAGKSLTSSGNDCDDLNPAVHQSTDLYADTDNDGFGAITATAVCVPVSCASNTIAINFRVDMTGQTITAGGVHVAGNFASNGSTTITSDWSPNAPNSQLRPIGNSIYELTVLFPASSAGANLEFKFLRGDNWFDGSQLSEQNVPGSCSSGGNRVIALPSKFMSFTAAYDQCPSSLQRFLCSGTDCNDNDATKNTTFDFYADADGDSFGAGALVSVCAVNATTPPTGYSLNSSDCDDTNASIYQFATFFVDTDGDGYDLGSASVCSGTTTPIGYATSSLGSDCDDLDVSKWRLGIFYLDQDGDGFGGPFSDSYCYGLTTPVNLSTNNTDCDDENSGAYQLVSFYYDNDGDSYTVGQGVLSCIGANPPVGTSLTQSSTDDCDDNDNTIFFGSSLWIDTDGDGYAFNNPSTEGGASFVCHGATVPPGYLALENFIGYDCDDDNNAIYQSTWLYTDADGDTYTIGLGSDVCHGADLPGGYALIQSTTDDCDDNDNTIFFGSALWIDEDGDGYSIGSASNEGGPAFVCHGATIPPGYIALENYIGYDCDDTNATTYRTDYLDLDADADGYSGGVSSSLVCYGATAPAGYVLVSLGVDCDDTNAALTNNCTTGTVINLKLFIEGYYLGAGMMNSVKLNQDGVSPPTEVEDLTIELRDATTYELIYAGTATLNEDGTVSEVCDTIQEGAALYYIVVKGTNLLQTWSALPRQIIGGTIDYDFSTAASQAYGDNMREMEPGVFAFYNGDVNQDEVIDNVDTDTLFLDIDAFAFGDYATDLNGDGSVDNTDTDNIFISIDAFRFSNHP
jgi:hypothetical protein